MDQPCLIYGLSMAMWLGRCLTPSPCNTVYVCQSCNLASEPLSVRFRRLRVRLGLQRVVCSSRLSLCMVSLQQPAFRLPHWMKTADMHCAGIRRGAWWHDLHSRQFTKCLKSACLLCTSQSAPIPAVHQACQCFSLQVWTCL